MFLAFSSVSPASHHFIIAPSPSITAPCGVQYLRPGSTLSLPRSLSWGLSLLPDIWLITEQEISLLLRYEPAEHNCALGLYSRVILSESSEISHHISPPFSFQSFLGKCLLTSLSLSVMVAFSCHQTLPSLIINFVERIHIDNPIFAQPSRISPYTCYWNLRPISI